MTSTSRQRTLELHGPLEYRLRGLMNLLWASAVTSLRRLVRGPRHPGWTWNFETTMRFLRAQSEVADSFDDVGAARVYEDSLLLPSEALGRVRRTPVQREGGGTWFEPDAGCDDNSAVLYLHGGGYAFDSRAHDNLIALVALATGRRVLAPDYPLAPEHPFPAQLDHARAAYRWLVEQGYDPGRIVVAGDSAGGNLVLALLVDLRDAGERLPAAAACLAPWTDLANPGESVAANDAYDWISKRMADRWSERFRNGVSATDPRVSPAHADLRGLPPLYLQAGSAEILLDMIRAFHQRAQAQGVDARLDVWDAMTHDFQAFGSALPESREALERIGAFVTHELDERVR